MADEPNDPATSYLDQLAEETMRRAWGEHRSPEERRRIVSAALLFGEVFDRRIEESPPDPTETGQQKFLMALMNDVIREFASREDVSQEEASAFLSDVETRDLVLEFNEVLEEHAANAPGKSLDELLSEAVENRQERAIWSDHWSSG